MIKKVLVLAAAIAVLAACDGNECTPGQQVECACPGGQKGAQACLENGSGYGECLGCQGAGGDGGSSSSSSSSSSTTSSSSSSSSTGSSSSGMGPDAGSCFDTCSEAIDNGSDVCDGKPEKPLLEDLVGCASASCVSECIDLITKHRIINTTCLMCLGTNCLSEYQACFH